MIHSQPHPLSGQTVTIQSGGFKGEKYQIEDWWDRVAGESWKFAEGNPACIDYAMRSGLKDDLPTDDEVLYGKIGYLGKLVHVSEIEAKAEGSSA